MSGLTVLIVEDSESQRDLLEETIHATLQNTTHEVLKKPDDVSFTPKDIKEWVRRTHFGRPGPNRTVLFLDLLWIDKSLRGSDAHEKRRNRYTELLMLSSLDIKRVPPELLPESFQLLATLDLATDPDFEVVTVSKYGSESVQRLCEDYGAEEVVKKFPELSKFYPELSSEPLGVRQARFLGDHAIVIAEFKRWLETRTPPLLDLIPKEDKDNGLDIRVRWDLVERCRAVHAPDPRLVDIWNRLCRFREHLAPDGRTPLDLDPEALRSQLQSLWNGLLRSRRSGRAGLKQQASGASLVSDSLRLRLPPTLRGNLHRLAQYATEETRPIVITGETGTGKTDLAKWLHDVWRSADAARAGAPFIKVLCQTIVSDELLKKELYGSVKGAFTDATDGPGKIELATGGTLLLDQLEDLKPGGLLSLYDLIQNNTFFRVGGNTEKTSTARLILTCTDPLDQLEAGSKAVSPLAGRLDPGVSIPLAPTRERTDDIPWFAATFLDRECRKHGKPAFLSDGAVRRLWRVNCPKNFRTIEAIVVEAYREGRLHSRQDGAVIELSEELVEGAIKSKAIQDISERSTDGVQATPQMSERADDLTPFMDYLLEIVAKGRREGAAGFEALRAGRPNNNLWPQKGGKVRKSNRQENLLRPLFVYALKVGGTHKRAADFLGCEEKKVAMWIKSLEIVDSEWK